MQQHLGNGHQEAHDLGEEPPRSAGAALAASLSPLDALASQTRTVKRNIGRSPLTAASSPADSTPGVAGMDGGDYFSRPPGVSAGDQVEELAGQKQRLGPTPLNLVGISHYATPAWTGPTPADDGPLPPDQLRNPMLYYSSASWNNPETTVVDTDSAGDDSSYIEMDLPPANTVQQAPPSPLGLSGHFRSTRRNFSRSRNDLPNAEGRGHHRGMSKSSVRSKATFETDSTDYVWREDEDEPDPPFQHALGRAPAPSPPQEEEPVQPSGLMRKPSTGHAPQRQTRAARHDTHVRSMIAVEGDEANEVLLTPNPVNTGGMLSPESAMFPRGVRRQGSKERGGAREASWTSANTGTSMGMTESAYGMETDEDAYGDGRRYASGVSGMSDPFEYSRYETPKTAQTFTFPTPPASNVEATPPSQPVRPPATSSTARDKPSSSYPNPALASPVQTRSAIAPEANAPTHVRNFSRPTRPSISSSIAPPPQSPLPHPPTRELRPAGLPTPPDSQDGSPRFPDEPGAGNQAPMPSPPTSWPAGLSTYATGPEHSRSAPDLHAGVKMPAATTGAITFAADPPHFPSSASAGGGSRGKSRLSTDTQSSSVTSMKRTWSSSTGAGGHNFLKSPRWSGKKLSFGPHGRKRGMSEASSKGHPDWIDLGGQQKAVWNEPPMLAFTGDVGNREEGAFEDELERARRERELEWERERVEAEREEAERRRREAEETEREVFRGAGYGHSTRAGDVAGAWGPMSPRSPYEGHSPFDDAYAEPQEALAVPQPDPHHQRMESLGSDAARYSLYSLPPEDQIVYSRAASRLSWGKTLDRQQPGGTTSAQADAVQRYHARFDSNVAGGSPTTGLPPSMAKAKALSSRGGSGDAGRSSPPELLQLGIEAHERGDLSRSATLFERSARENGGCGAGMLMWGLALRHGWGCAVNQTRGFKWLQKAAESVVEDLDKAVREERFEGADGTDGEAVVARNELVLAIYELGQCFMRGWGCKKDKPLGVSYFELAAQLGDPDAQQELGFCYANGRGCKKDLRQAAHFYRLAAAQGYQVMGNQWIWKEKYQ